MLFQLGLLTCCLWQLPELPPLPETPSTMAIEAHLEELPPPTPLSQLPLGPAPLWVKPDRSSTFNASWNFRLGPKEISLHHDPAPPSEAVLDVDGEIMSPWSTASHVHALQMILSRGDGRFNIIDWEERPRLDTLFGLADWTHEQSYFFDVGVGFNIHWWSGPTGDGAAVMPDLPPRVYDLYLDLVWRQLWSAGVSSEVRFLPGLYTDFRTTPPDAFRIPGHAIGVFSLTNDLHLAAGVMHLQRNRIKMLPVGGLLWQPTPRWQFQLVFPEPKISFLLDEQGTYCVYARGEYGGGRWSYKNDDGHAERVEYSDLRVAVGFEVLPKVDLPIISKWRLPNRSFVEVGYVFQRQLHFTNGWPETKPTDGWLLSVGYVW